MNSNTLVQDMREEGMPRRTFLRNSVMMAAPLALTGFSIPTMATAAYDPVSRPRGSTRLNVRNFGALGDGASDYTAEIQAAINALPSDGGTVYIPAGTYPINVVKSIQLRSRMHLELDPGAKLVAIANGAEKTYILLANKCSDVEISGGQLIGERYKHLVTTGEWGHGIFIRGSKRVTIRDLRCADFWGDGISLGAALVWQGDPIVSDDVVIANVICTNNRRQALTVGRAYNVKVYDSEFSRSNGVKPETGIDIEPDDPGIAYKVHFENCVIRDNKTYGVNIWKKSQGITFKKCIIEDNGSCGIVTYSCSSIYVATCTIRNNSATGIRIKTTTDNMQISQCTFYGNYNRLSFKARTPFELVGWASKIERDILIEDGATDIRITTNYYR